jgi:predicted nucleotidyltransferase
MSINYLKKAAKTPETETSNAQEVVTEMLSNIEKHGESAVKEYALKLDKWSGDIVMSDQAINAALADVPSSVKKDIDFAVMVSSIKEYEKISNAMEAKGFKKVAAPWTLYSDSFKIAIDLLPFGEIEEKFTDHFTQRHVDLHFLGFREVMEESVSVNIDERMVNIPPLPGMVILKLIAWSDRPEERLDDLSDILKIILNY